MIVLGLNGWDDGTHDPAAALIVDGQVVSFVEEERLTRVRHAVSKVPVRATAAVLREAGIHLEDVDIVAYGWELRRYHEVRGGRLDCSDRDFIREATGISQLAKHPKLVWVPHHLAYAASSYFWEPRASGCVVVVDGCGETESVSIFRGAGSDLTLVESWPLCRSLGLLYQAATEYCGFGFLDAGKTMGLASYGRPEQQLALRWTGQDIASAVDPTAHESEVVASWMRTFADRYGSRVVPKRRFDALRSVETFAVDAPVSSLKPQVAADAQATVENLLIQLVRHAVRVTGESEVCTAGGVALNCVANGRLVSEGIDLHVPPAPHDAGVALGAAMIVAAQCGEAVQQVCTPALGPQYTSDQVRTVLRSVGVSYSEVDDVGAAAADEVLRGHVVGWFQGRAEVGPRALGQRSILASAADPVMKNRVNDAKGRELWRPFAPSMLAKDAGFMFGTEVDSPYMLQSFPLTDTARSRYPAIAHVDGTARPQTVGSANGPFAELLRHIDSATGHGVVLNTSFNGPGEPIVCSPVDALRSFYTSALDVLVMENTIVRKESRGSC